MDFYLTEGFNHEVKLYNLKYKCDDCAHFDGQGNRCSFDHPMSSAANFYVMDYGEKHSKYGPRFSFCKHFELN